MQPATQQLLDSYQQELLEAAARMDNAKGDFKAYRNAQADWNSTADIIYNLRTAHLSAEEIEAAEAVAENDIQNAGPYPHL